MDADRLQLLVSFLEIIPFKYPRDGVLRGQSDQSFRVHRPKPLAVKTNCGFLRVEHLEDLSFIGLRILEHLFSGQLFSRLGPSAWVPDHSGKITD
ncbi:MAG: hypothetical protein MPW14_03725 [Candidatus Manganitrophus sp.]|nr:MAG: hypothetical protein MPW14_03725 [Candidatus Manganitrophus sp.]